MEYEYFLSFGSSFYIAMLFSNSVLRQLVSTYIHRNLTDVWYYLVILYQWINVILYLYCNNQIRSLLHFVHVVSVTVYFNTAARCFSIFWFLYFFIFMFFNLFMFCSQTVLRKCKVYWLLLIYVLSLSITSNSCWCHLWTQSTCILQKNLFSNFSNFFFQTYTFIILYNIILYYIHGNVDYVMTTMWRALN